MINGASTAMTHGFKVIVIHGECGAPNAEAHKAALTIMQGRTMNKAFGAVEYIASEAVEI